MSFRQELIALKDKYRHLQPPAKPEVKPPEVKPAWLFKTREPVFRFDGQLDEYRYKEVAHFENGEQSITIVYCDETHKLVFAQFVG